MSIAKLVAKERGDTVSTAEVETDMSTSAFFEATNGANMGKSAMEAKYNQYKKIGDKFFDSLKVQDWDKKAKITDPKNP